MIYKPNFFVITGGPGVGKTTLLEALAKQGFPYVPEVAREIIREQASRNGDAPPLGKYTRLHPPHAFPLRGILRTAPKTGICSFLRPGYPRHPRLRTPHPSIPISRTPTCRSRFPLQSAGIHSSPFAEIYETDSERKQTYQEVVETYDVMLVTYQQLDYSPIIVPKGTPEERANFVIDRYNQTKEISAVR